MLAAHEVAELGSVLESTLQELLERQGTAMNPSGPSMKRRHAITRIKRSLAALAVIKQQLDGVPELVPLEAEEPPKPKAKRKRKTKGG